MVLWDEHRCGQLYPLVREVLGERRANPRRLQLTQDAASVVESHAEVEREDVLECDDIPFHAGYLSDVSDATRAVLESRLVNNDVDSGGDLLANRSNGKLYAGHQDHGFEPGQDITRGVGVDRRDAPLVTGVHRLEHVQSLRSPRLTDDDPVGAHAERVADEVAGGDFTLALD